MPRVTRLLLCTAISFFAASLPVLAREDAPGRFCALARELSHEVARLTPYPAADTCPEIGFGVLAAAATNRSQAGAYFPETGRIELAPDLDMATVYGKSFLLHELVHAAQYRAGTDKTAACPAALEAEAYQAQAQFMIENGLGQDGIMTAVLGGQLGRCGASEDAY